MWPLALSVPPKALLVDCSTIVHRSRRLCLQEADNVLDLPQDRRRPFARAAGAKMAMKRKTGKAPAAATGDTAPASARPVSTASATKPMNPAARPNRIN